MGILYIPMPTLNQSRKRNLSLSSPPNIVMGKLHANWCGHCIALKPEWAKMKTLLNKQYGGKVQYADIESENMDSKLAELNQKYLSESPEKVALQGGFPTIFKISGGKVQYYDGARTSDAMVQWATKNATQPQNQTEVVGGARNKVCRNKKTRKSWWQRIFTRRNR